MCSTSRTSASSSSVPPALACSCSSERTASAISCRPPYPTAAFTGTHPVPVVGIDVAHLPGPSTVAVTHHADVQRARLALQRTGHPPGVDGVGHVLEVAVAQALHLHACEPSYPAAPGQGPFDRSLLPRPLASRRSDAPSSLLAALVSPDDAAPLPLASSVRAEAGLQRVEFGPEHTGQLVPELLEPLDDLWDLRLPLLDVDGESGLDVRLRYVQAGQVERARRRVEPDRRLHRRRAAVEPLEDPLEYPRVLAEPGPQEPAVIAAPEPVDVEDLRQLGGVAVGTLAHLDPVREVVAAVVPDERQHRHRIAAHDADLADRGRGGLRGEGGAEVHAVHPVARLCHQGDGRLAAAAEEDRVDRYALRVLVLRGQDRALGDRGAEPGVRVRRQLT